MHRSIAAVRSRGLFGRGLALKLAALTGLLIAVLALAGGASARPAVSWSGGAGVGLQRPYDRGLGDLYGTSLTFHIGVEADLAALPLPLPLSIGAGAGYSRRTADLGGAFFVAGGKGTLEWIPIELVARAHTRSTRSLQVFGGAGLLMLRTRESFEYRLGDRAGERDPEAHWSPGLLLVAGFDRTTAPRLRLEGTFSLVTVDRKTDAGGSEYPAADGDANAGTIGLRVSWRLP